MEKAQNKFTLIGCKVYAKFCPPLLPKPNLHTPNLRSQYHIFALIAMSTPTFPDSIEESQLLARLKEANRKVASHPTPAEFISWYSVDEIIEIINDIKRGEQLIQDLSAENDSPLTKDLKR